MENNHSMSRVERSRREKVTRYSVRKVSFGAASVAVAAFFMFLGNGAVYAAEPNVTATDSALAANPANNQFDENSGASEATAPKAQADTTTPTPADSSSTSVESATASTVQDETPAPTPVDESVASVTPAPASATEEVEEKATSDLDKKQLEDYVAEIDAKLASGSYATKTDESVATLKEHLYLAKLALTTATSQEELTKAYRRLFMTASSGLRSKPKAQVESPKLDTTEGKATVGKKASNTEKATGTNSIANSGQHDPRNRQALDRNNPFRTDGATTDTDPAAHQTYTAPSANASVEELVNALKNLPDKVENNKKIQNMTEVGASTDVAVGEVKEIHEFGGWTAVDSNGEAGKFAIARKTDKGVFPIETINVLGNNDVWTIEQSFDRTNDYMLFLSKVRTKANRTEESFDNRPYIESGEGGPRGASVARGTKGFRGIEKVFKAYSSTEGSKVQVSFKTGYTGDINGTKAQYKVEVFTDQDGFTKPIYSTSFSPQNGGTGADRTVVAAKDGTTRNKRINIGDRNKQDAETFLSQAANMPNGTGGSFTSREIDLPKGVTSYKVRISSADDEVLGMSYQSRFLQYALPVTGLNFNITQDTKQIAKSLLQQAYNKLLEDQQKDEHRKTEDSVHAYQEKLAKIKELLDSNELKNNSEYLSVLESAVDSRNDLVEQNFEAKIVKQVKDSQVLTDLSTHPEKVITYKENSVEKALPDDLVASWKNTPDFTTVGTHTGTVVISKKGDAGAKNQEIAEVTVPITIYPKAEAKQAKFVNVLTENNRLLDGDNPENYVKFVNGNQTVAKPMDVTVTWHEKPSTTTANVDQKGIVKVSYSATDENGALSTQSYLVTVNVPVYHATLRPDTQTTTFGVNFTVNDSRTITRTNYPDGSKIKSYWGSTNFQSSARSGAANYLGKRTDQVQVLYPNSNDQVDYVDARSEKVTATFVVKPVRPSLVSSLAKVGSNEVTVDNVNSGTTVVLYDVSNPDNPIELGSVAVPNEGNFNTKSGIKVPLNSGKMLAKGQQIAARTIYAPLDDAQRTESDFSETFLVPQVDKTALEAAKAELDKGIQAAPDTSGKTPDSVKAYNQAKTEAETAAQEAQTVIDDQNANEQAVQEAIAKVTKAKEALDQAKTNLTPAATEQDKQALTDAKNNLDTPATTTGMTPESIDAYNKAKEAAQAQVDEAKAEAQAALAKGANATQAEVAAAKEKVDAAQQALDAAKAKLVPQVDKAALEAAKAELDKGIQAAPDTSGKTPDSVKAYNQAKTEAETAAQEAQTVIDDQNANEQAVQEAIAKVTKAKEALDQAKTNLTPAATEQDKQALTDAKNNLDTPATTTGMTPESIDAYNKAKEAAQAQVDEAKAEAQAALAKGANATQAEVAAAKEKVDAAQQALDAAKAKLVPQVDKAALEAAKAELDKGIQAAPDTSGKTPDSVKAYNQAKTEAETAAQEAQTVIDDQNANEQAVQEAIAKVTKAKEALDQAKTNLTPAATEQDKQALTDAKNNLDTPATTTGMTPESIDAYNKAKEAAQAQVDEAKAEAQAALAKGANATQAEVAAAKEKVDAAQQALDAAKAKLVPQVDKAALEAAKAELDKGIQAAPDTSGKTPDSVKAYNQAKTEAETAAQEAQTVIDDQNANEQAVQEAIAKVTKAKEALDQAKTNLTPAATEQDKQALTDAKNNLDTPATTTGMTPESIDAYNKAKEAAQAQVDEAKAEAQAALAKGANATQAEVAAAKEKVDAAQQALDAAKAKLVPQVDKAALEAAKAELDKGIQAAPDTSGKTPDSVKAYNQAKTEAETAAQEAQTVIDDQNANEQAVQEAIAKVTKAKEALDQAKTNLTPAATEQDKQALTDAKNNLDTPATTTGMTPESIDAYNKAKEAAQAQVDEAKAEAQAALAKGANATQAEVAAAKEKVDAAQQALDAAKAKLVPQVDKAALEAAKAELDKGIQAAPDTSGKTPDSVKAYNQAKTEAETAAQEAQTVIDDQNANEQAVQEAIAKVTKAKEALDQAKTNLTPAATEQDKQALTDAKNNLDTPATTTGMTPESIDAYNKAKEAAQAQVDEAKAEAQAALAKGANATQAEVAAAKEKVDAAQQALDAAKAKLVPQVDKAALEAAKAELDKGIQAAPDTSGKTPDSVKAYNQAKTEAETAAQEAQTVIDDQNANEQAVQEAIAKVTKAKEALDQAKTNLTPAATEQDKQALTDAKNNLDTPATTTGMTPESIDAYNKAKEAAQAQVDEAKAEAQAALAKGANATQAEVAAAKEKVDAAQQALDAAKAKLVPQVDKAALEAAKAELDKGIQAAPDTSGKTPDSVKAYNQAKTEAETAAQEAQTVIDDQNANEQAVQEAIAKVTKAKEALDQAKTNLTPAATEQDKQALTDAKNNLDTPATTTGMTPESIDAYNKAKEAAQAQVDEAKAEAQAALAKGANATQAEVAAAKEKVDAAQQALDAAKAKLVPQVDKAALEAAKAELDKGIQAAPDTSGKTPDSVKAYNQAKTEAETAAQEAQTVIDDQNANEQAVQEAIAKVTKAKEALDQAKTNLTPAATEQDKQALTDAKNNLDTPATTTGMTPESIDAYNKAKEAAQAQVDEAKAEAQAALAKGANATQAEVAAAKEKVDAAQQALDAAKAKLVPQVDKAALEAAKAELDKGIQAAPDTSGKTPDSVKAYNQAKTEAETAAQEAQTVIDDQNANEQAVQEAIAKVTKAKEALDQAKTNLTPAATEQDKQALTDAKNNLDTPATTTGMTPESIDAYNKAKEAAQAQVDEAKAEAQAALAKGANATQAEVAAAKEKVDAAQQALDAAKAKLVPQVDKAALEAAKAELDKGIQAAPDTSGKTPDSVKAYNQAKTEAETAAQEAQTVIDDQNANEQAVQEAIAKVTKAKEALDQAKTNLTPAATEQDKQALTDAKNNLDTPATTTGMTPESIDAYNKAKEAAQAQVDEAKAEAQAALAKGANATQAEVAAAKEKVDAAQQALDAAKAKLVPQVDKAALEAAKAELDKGIQAAPDTSGKTPDSVKAYNQAKTEAETAAQEAQTVIDDQNANEQAVQEAIAKVTKAKEALDQAKTNLTPAATEQDKQALTDAKNNLDTPATTTGMTPESIDAYNKAKEAAQAQVDEAKAEAQAALAKGANATQAEVAAAKEKVDAAQQALDAAKAKLVPQVDKAALEAAKAELDKGIQAAPDTSGKTPDSVKAYNQAKTEAETAAQEAQTVIDDQNANEQAVQEAIAKVTKAKEALDQAKTNLTPAATEQDKQALTDAKNNLDTPATTTGMTPESIDAYNKAKEAAQAQVDEAKAEAQAALAKGANATQAEVAAAKEKVDAAQQALDAAKAKLVPQVDKAALEAAKAELDKGIQAAPDTSGKTPDSVKAYNQAKTEAETAAQEAQTVIDDQNANEQAVQEAIAKVTKAKEALDQAKTNLTPAATEQDKQALTDAKNNLDTPATTTGMTPESIDAYNKAKEAAQAQVDEAKAEAQAALAKGANATQAEVAAAKEKVDAAQQALDAAKAKLVPQVDKAALEAAKAELDKGIQAAPDTSGKTPDSVKAYNQAKTEAETAAQEAQTVIDDQNANEQAVQEAIAKVTKAKEALDQAKTNLTPAATEQDKQALTDAKNNLDTPATTTGMTPESIDAYNKAKEAAQAQVDEAKAEAQAALAKGANATQAEVAAAKEKVDAAQQALDAAKAKLVPQVDKAALEAAKAELDKGIQAAPDTSGKTPDSVKAYNQAKTEAETAAQEAQTVIDDQNANEQAVQEAIAKVTKAKEALDQAKTNLTPAATEQDKQALTDAKNNLDTPATTTGMTPESIDAYNKAKEAAQAQVDEAKAEAQAALAKGANATQAEVAAAKEKVDAAQQALDAAKAKLVPQVDKAALEAAKAELDKGIQAAPDTSGKTPDSVKAYNQAKTEAETAAQEAQTVIDDQNANEQAVQEAIAKVTKAKEALDQAKTNLTPAATEQDKQALTDAKNNLDTPATTTGMTPESIDAYNKAKEAAQAQVDEAKAEAQAALAKGANATQAEVAAAKEKVDAAQQALDAAKAKLVPQVDKAALEAAKAELDKGIQAAPDTSGKTPDSVKAYNQAKTEAETAAQEAQTVIDDQNANEQAVQEAIAKVTKAKEALDQAKTNLTPAATEQDKQALTDAKNNLDTPATTTGMTPESIDAYNKAKEAAQAQVDEAKAEAQAALAKGANATQAEVAAAKEKVDAAQQALDAAKAKLVPQVDKAALEAAKAELDKGIQAAPDTSGKTPDSVKAYNQAKTEAETAAQEAQTVIDDQNANEQAVQEAIAKVTKAKEALDQAKTNLTPAATEQDKQALTDAKNNLDTPATTTGMTPESIDAYNKAKEAAQAQVDEAKAEAQAALAKGANATQAEVAAAKEKVDAAQQALDAAKAKLVPQVDKAALEAAKAELDKGIQAAPDTSGKTPDSVKAYNQAKTEAETAAQEAQTVIDDQNANEQAVQEAIAKVTKAKEALDQAKTNLTPAATEQDKQALTDAKNNLDTPATTTGMTPESIDAYNKAKEAAQAQVDEAKAEAQAALAKGANATQAEVAAAKEKVDAAQQALDAAKAKLVPQVDKAALEAAKAELDKGIQAAPDTSGKTPDSVKAYNQAKTEAETAAQEAQTVIDDQNANEQAVQEAIAKVTKAKEALDQAKTNLTPAATEQDKQALTDAKNNLDTPATTTGMTPESIDAYNKAKEAAQAQVDEAKAEAQAALAKGANATQAEVAAAKEKVDAAQQALDAAKAKLVPQVDKAALEAAKAELDKGIQAAPDTSGKTPDSVKAYNQAKTEAETAAQEAQTVIDDQNANEQAVQEAIAKVTKAKEALDQAKTNLTPAATEQDKQALTDAKNNLDTPATTTGMTPESIDAYNKAKEAAQAQVDEAKAEAQAALAKGANATQAEVAAAKEKVDAAQQALDAAKAKLVPQVDKAALEAAKAELDKGIQAAPDTSGKTPDSVKAYNQAKTEAETAAQEAQTVIDDQNANEQAVQEAIAKVTKAKEALDQAKTNLTPAATEQDKQALTDAKNNLDTPATTTGMTPESIDAYNKAKEAAQAQVDEAKAEAQAALAKGANATQAEVAAAKEKVDAAQQALDAAKAKLVPQVDKAALEAAKAELDKGIQAAPDTSGKTPDSVKAYNQAKTEAETAAQEAQTVIDDQNANEQAVQEAIAKVTKAKEALDQAKTNLTPAATEQDKQALTDAKNNLDTPATTTGMTPESIDAYNKAKEAAQAQVDEAKAEAQAALAKGANATQAEVAAAKEKVDAAQQALDAAKAKLVPQVDKAALEAAKAELDKGIQAAPDTSGKTPDSVKAYNQAKTEAETAAQEAQTVIDDQNANEQAVQEAIAKVTKAKEALDQAKTNLTPAATEQDKQALTDAKNNLDTPATTTGMTPESIDAYNKAKEAAQAQVDEAKAEAQAALAKGANATQAEVAAAKEKVDAAQQALDAAKAKLVPQVDKAALEAAKAELDKGIQAAPDTSGKTPDSVKAYNQAKTEAETAAQEAQTVIDDQNANEQAVQEAIAKVTKAKEALDQAKTNLTPAATEQDKQALTDAKNNLDTPATTTGMTPESIDAYNKAKEAAQAQVDEAKAEAQAALAKGANATQAEVAAAKEKVDAAQQALDAAKAKLVPQVDKAALEAAKAELDKGIQAAPDTSGKTPDSVKAYNQAKTEAETAAQEAQTVIDDQNANEQAVQEAIAKVTKAKEALDQAKTNLTPAATEQDKQALTDAKNNLDTPATTTGMTPESIDAYNKAKEAAQAQVDEAKAEAQAALAKGANATQAEVAAAKEKVDAAQQALDAAKAKLVPQVDKAALEAAKAELDKGIQAAPDTSGKTPDSVKAYNQAKTEAETAAQEAQTVIDDQNANEQAVQEAIAKVTKAKEALDQAKTNLTPAATEQDKQALTDAKNNLDTPATTTGMTPESIDAYNKAKEAAQAQVDEAKAEAQAALAKGANATQAEVAAAKEKVDAAQQALDAAKAKLVPQVDKAALEAAKAELDKGIQAAPDTSGKTPDSVKAYNQAKTEAETAAQEAQTVIDDQNANEQAVQEAIAKVTKAKEALDQAKTNLTPAATEQDKQALTDAKNNLDTPATTTGMTPESIDAYNKAKEAAQAQVDEAKAEAQAALAKGANATQAEVAAAKEKVDAAQQALDAAKAKLVPQVDKAALEAAKAELDKGIQAAPDTSGKTPDSVKAYNQAKTEAETAAQEAQTVIDDQNANEQAVQEAIAKVTKAKEALDQAKTNLTPAATEQDKQALTDAKNNLDTPATTTGMTPESIDAYNKAKEAAQAQVDEAKAEAQAALAKGANATQAEVAAAKEKVDAAQQALDAAKAKLVPQVDKAALEAAKAELDKGIQAAPDTSGKTPDSVKAYNQAKTEAETAAQEAQTVIDDQNANEQAVQEAIAKVTKAKEALDQAKTNLTPAATEQDKQALTDAKNNLDTPATTTGMTPESIDAYNKAKEAAQAQVDEAKAEAQAALAKGANATQAEVAAAKEKVDAAQQALDAAKAKLVPQVDKAALEAAKAELDKGIQAAPDTSGKTPDSVKAYNQAKTEAETAAQEAQTVIDDQNANEQAVQEAIAKVTKAKEALDQAKTNLTPAATEQDKQALTDAKNNLDTPATTTGMTPESIDAYNKAKEAAQAQVDEAKAEAQAALAKGANATQAEVAAAKEKVDAAQQALDAAKAKLVPQVDKAALEAAKAELDKGIQAAPDTSGKTPDSVKAYNQAKTEAETAAQEAQTVIDDQNANEQAVQEAIAKVTKAKEALDQAKTNLTPAATEQDKQALTDAKNNLDTPATTTGMTPESIDAYNKAKEAAQAQVDEAKAEAQAALAKGANATQAEVAAAKEKVDAAQQALDAAKAKLVPQVDKAALEAAKAELDKGIQAAPDTSGKTPDSVKAYNQAKTEAETAAQEAQTVIDDQNANEQAVQEAIAKVTKAKEALDQAKTNLTPAATEQDKQALTDAKNNLDTPATTTGMTPESIDAYNKAKEAAQAQVDEAKAEAQAALAKGANATQAEVAAAKEKVDAAQQALDAAKAKLVPQVDKAALEAAKAELDKGIQAAPDTSGKTPDSVKAYNQAKTEAETAAQEAQTVIDDQNANEQAVQEAIAKVTKAKEALDQAKTNLTPAATEQDKQALTDAKNNLDTPATTTGMTPESIDAYNKAKEAAQAQVDEAKAEAQAALAKGANATQAEVAAAKEKVDAAQQALDAAKAKLVPQVDKAALEAAKAELDKGIQAAPDTSGKTPDSVKAYNQAKTEAETAAQEAQTVIDDQNANEQAVQEAIAKVTKAKEALDQAKTNLTPAATEQDKQALTDAKNNLDTPATTTGMTPESIDAYNKAKEAAQAQVDEAKAEAQAALAKGANATQAEVAAAKEKVDAAQQALDAAKAKLVPQVDKAALEAAKAELDKGIQAAPDTSGKTPDSVKAYNQAKTEAETAAQEAQTVIDDQNANEQAVQEAIAKVTKAKEALDQAKTNLTPAATEQDKQALTDAKNNLDTPATTTGMTPESIDAYNKAKEAAQAQVDEAKAEAQAALAKGANATQAEVAAAKEKVDAAQQALDAAKAKLVPQVDKAALEAAKAELDKGIQAAPDTSGKTPDSVKAYNQAKTEAETAAQEAQTVIDDQNANEQAVQEAIAKVTKAKEALDQAKTNLTPAATEQDKQALTKEQAKSEIDKAAAAKIQAIEGNDKLSESEKSAAKAAAKQAADDAKKAIDAATTQAEVDRILRNDIYKDDAAINEVEAFDLSSLLVNGFVSVKQGETLTDQEVLSKVNLPKDVEVIKVEKPTTSALGRLVAKVTLKLSDGSVEEINVPVEVVAPQNQGNEGNGANNGDTNTEAKVNKAKLEAAIHQLDELLLKETAKLDAETAKEANVLSADAKKVFANADATQAEVDAMVKRIEDFMAKVASSTDHATPANDQAAQKPAVAPATTQAAANASQEAATNARKAAKELPNTGTADSTVAMVAAAASALLGLGLAGRRRKEDEEA